MHSVLVISPFTFEKWWILCEMSWDQISPNKSEVTLFTVWTAWKVWAKKRKFLLLKQCVFFDILITIFNCTLQEQKEEEVLFLEPCGSPRKIMCLVMMEQVDLRQWMTILSPCLFCHSKDDSRLDGWKSTNCVKLLLSKGPCSQLQQQSWCYLWFKVFLGVQYVLRTGNPCSEKLYGRLSSCLDFLMLILKDSYMERGVKLFDLKIE